MPSLNLRISLLITAVFITVFTILWKTGKDEVYYLCGNFSAGETADAEDPIVQDAAAPESHAAPSTPSPLSTADRSRWARLTARIYEVSPLACPDCGAEMRILAPRAGRPEASMSMHCIAL